MAGDMGHTGGLTNPRPWRGRCRASYSNTGGPPLPRKRAPTSKNVLGNTKAIFYHRFLCQGICSSIPCRVLVLGHDLETPADYNQAIYATSTML